MNYCGLALYKLCVKFKTAKSPCTENYDGLDYITASNAVLSGRHNTITKHGQACPRYLSLHTIIPQTSSCVKLKK